MKGERGFRIKFGMTFWYATIVVAIMLTFAFVSCDTSTTSRDNDNPVTYSITIAEGIEHGTISASVTSAEAGTAIKLTATPEDGYALETFSVKDSDEKEIAVIEGIFLMPKSDVTVSATFKDAAQIEPTEAQKEASGKYTIGEKTYNVKDGKVSVTEDDGTEKQVGEISKEGVITITENEKTTVISVEKSEDGKTTTTVKIETKDKDGKTVTKTYTGDVSTGTLVNKDDENDSLSVEKESAGQSEKPVKPVKWTVTLTQTVETL